MSLSPSIFMYRSRKLSCNLSCRSSALAGYCRMFGFRSNPLVGCFSGVPSQKPKEQQRSVLRPAVLQAPPTKKLPEPSKSSEYTYNVCFPYILQIQLYTTNLLSFSHLYVHAVTVLRVFSLHTLQSISSKHSIVSIVQML